MLTFRTRVDDMVTSRSEAVQSALKRGAHLRVVGRSAHNVVRDHFAARGGEFYGGAARSTHYGVEGGKAFVGVDQVGIALRFFGGTVRPGPGKKYLAVPAKDNDQAKNSSPRRIVGLHFRQNHGKPSGRLTDNSGRVFYWLVKETVHKPDPTVLPTEDKIMKQVKADLGVWVDVLEHRS